MCRARFQALSLFISLSAATLAGCGADSAPTSWSEESTFDAQSLRAAATAGPIQYNANTQYCVDIRGSATANGTSVQLWPCNGSNAQTWTYTNGALKGLGKCLDIPGRNAANGAKLRIWDCNNSRGQRWAFWNGYIYNANTSKCLDLPNNNVAAGQQLQLWDCYANNDAQQWTFPGTGAGTSGGTSAGNGTSTGSGTTTAGGTSAGSGSGSTTGGSGSGSTSGGTGSGNTDTLADILPLATSHTGSTRTSMGVNFERVLSIKPTAAQTAFLTDPTQQPPIPGSAPGLHLKSFNVTLYPSGTPMPTDVNQHALGNCDGDSAMVSMAYVAPNFVKSLITDRGNGVYNVRVYAPDGSKFTIAVNNTFLADGSNNLAAVSGKNGIATWATVLEKAIMKYIVVYPIIDDIGGIGAEWTTPIFTGAGNSYAFDRGVLSASQLTRAAKALLAQGKFIAGGFGQVMTIGNAQSVTAHGYAVLIPNGSAMMSMRNPWGMSPTTSGGYDSSTDGVLNIPATAQWASTIDLRVIDPGAAGNAGRTSAYAPDAEALITNDFRVSEPHAHESR